MLHLIKKCFSVVLLILFSQLSFAQVDGLSEEYFDNGQLKKQGYYKDKKFSGEWKEYHSNGQLAKVYSYTDGKLNKEKISCFDNGIISSETKKINGAYIVKDYYESGSLFYERTLNNGFYKEYLENGAIAIESNYVDGELSGAWKKFNNTGALEWVVHYKDGYRDGVYQNYYKNGQLKLEGNMLKNKKHGEEKRYLEDGQLEWSGKYKADLFNKTWVQYDVLGKVLHKKEFVNGVNKIKDDKIDLFATPVPDGLLERMPIYPGCEMLFSNKAWRKCLNTSISQFISSNFSVNMLSVSGLEGLHRISVLFKIGKDGAVSDIQVKTQHPVLGREAIRVINLLPKMQPGMQRGKPVIVPYALPIVFNIPENKTNTRKN